MFARAFIVFVMCVILLIGMKTVNSSIEKPKSGLAEQRFPKMQMVNWAMNILAYSFTFDQATYKNQFQSAQKYFLPQAYEQYGDIITRLGVIPLMKNGDLTSLARVPNYPMVTASGITDGVFEWAINIDLVLTVVQNNEPQEVPLRFRILVRQAPKAQYDDELVIASIKPLALNEGDRLP